MRSIPAADVLRGDSVQQQQQELKLCEILLVIDPRISSFAGFVLRLIGLQSRLPLYNCSR